MRDWDRKIIPPWLRSTEQFARLVQLQGLGERVAPPRGEEGMRLQTGWHAAIFAVGTEPLQEGASLRSRAALERALERNLSI